MTLPGCRSGAASLPVPAVGVPSPRKHRGGAAGAAGSCETSANLLQVRAEPAGSGQDLCRMADPSPARLCTALHVCVGLASPGTRGGMPASCLQPRLVGRGPRKILLGADPLPKLCSSSGLGTLPHHPPTPRLLSGP